MVLLVDRRALLAVVFRPPLVWVAGGVGAGLLLPLGAIGFLLGLGWAWGCRRWAAGGAVGRDVGDWFPGS